jgi:hypothetical protein
VIGSPTSVEWIWTFRRSRGRHRMIVLDTNVVSELARPAPDQRVIDWVDG